jgi:hypothetical protein
MINLEHVCSYKDRMESQNGDGKTYRQQSTRVARERELQAISQLLIIPTSPVTCQARYSVINPEVGKRTKEIKTLEIYLGSVYLVI